MKKNAKVILPVELIIAQFHTLSVPLQIVVQINFHAEGEEIDPP